MATLSITTPDKFRVIYPWMPKKSIYSGDIKREEYWTPSGFTEPDALVTDRNSKIFLPDVDGVYQEVDQDKLSRTNRGLYANGQYGLENYSSVDFSASSAWSDAPSFSLVAVSSVFSGQSAYRHTGKNQSSHGRIQNRILSSAGIIRISAIIEQVSATSFDIGISVRSPFSWIGLGRFTWSTGLITTAAGNIADSEVQNLGTGPNGGALRLITFTVDTGAVTDTTMWMYPNGVPANTDQTIVHFVGYQYPAFPLQPPAISPNNAKFTTMASDIRAVQGVRPSNGQPEPFPGWEAAGLDDAVAGKAVVSIDRLNASAARFVAGAGVDADNLWRLIFDTDNRFKLIVRKSGVDEVSLQTGAVAATGDKTVTWQAKPGDYAIAATGVAGDTDSDGATLPTGATTLRIGSDIDGANPYNGWIKNVQVVKME